VSFVFDLLTRKENSNEGTRCYKPDNVIFFKLRVKYFWTMSKSKNKSTKFTAGIEARRRARELAGPPPAARVIPDKRLKPPKHKRKLTEESDR